MKYLLSMLLLAGMALSACTTSTQPTTVSVPSASQPTPANTSPATGGDNVTFKIIAGKSQASYTVNETFLNENNRLNTAVGITSQITGEIYANKANPPTSTLGTITVDLSQLTSDSSRRDGYIRQNFLESSKYPLATFVPDKIDSLPATYLDGQNYSFKVSGKLTVHNVTKPVTFDVSASLKGDTLSGMATTTLLMSDFGVGPISLLGMLKTEDKVEVKLTFTASPSGN